MNIPRMIDAFNVIMDECEKSECANCPMGNLCLDEISSSLWSVAYDSKELLEKIK